VAARRSPLTTPQWGCAHPAPDGLILLFFGLPVGAAVRCLERAAPSTFQQGAAVFPVVIHRLFTGRPHAFPPAIHRTAISLRLSEPTNRARIAPLGRTHSRRASAAWTRPRSCPHNPARPRFPPHYGRAPAISHLGTLPAPARYLGWAMLSGGSKRVKRGPPAAPSCLQLWARSCSPRLPVPNCIQIWDMNLPKQVGVVSTAAARSPPRC